MDKILHGAAIMLAYSIVALMMILVVASLLGNRGGSLDDLDAATIKSVVDGGAR